MTFPIKINDHPVSADTFVNNKWKETDYYLLSTKSEGVSCAYLVALDKQVTANANEPLLPVTTITDRRRRLERTMLAEVSPQELADFIVLYGGYLDTDKGFDFPIETCWNNYKAILTWVRAEKDHSITKWSSHNRN